MTTSLPTVADIAAMIDHAILKPELTEADVIAQIELADKLRVYSVCVRPSDVELAHDFLERSSVRVGTVVGFPHGTSTTSMKAVEALQAIDNGAVEIDFVINIGKALAGDYAFVAREVSEIVEATRQAGVQKTKVIFENSYFNFDQIEKLTQFMTNTGVDFVKTSTGFASSGAKLNDVAIMKYNAAHMEVKASGGVKTLDEMLKFIEVGVTRFGTSNAETILADLAQRHETGIASGAVGESDY